MVGGCRDAVDRDPGGDSDGFAVVVDEGRLVGGVVGLAYGGKSGEKDHDVDKLLKHEADYQDNHFRFQLVVQVE